ncbi:DNA-binding LytR/AlgR family response regulator [Pedobacter cryoconitis]|uniref:DNA-binding LytR/AlgR family response regulator n=1 Tax=Pedobacter cryoconitis TaxID=188932 RepID=A0A7W9DYH1_9SPHI|nr:LytTR family DNA-binding domain-containing protein [Pedobacter cryoconitis]MBB5635993.1 DNA-binding LytR/AlgR family response regulator [Pedobacter cryoconitis]MBB6273091.1 DNA-binding LytR/AlgR family response regulator [Pedobacter cryoconitis]
MIAIAIDDEPIALDVVKSHASKVSFITLQAVFTNAFDAIAFLQQNEVDLIFLDIKMPDINGIDFLNSLSNPPLVIFTTAYAEHAVKGFELNALDYLLKPFSLARFLKACNKAEELHSLRKKANNSPQSSAYLFIKDGYEQIKVEINNILFIEAAGNYTQINLLDNSSLSTRMPISEMHALLPAKKFIRTHRAFIVAKNAVTRFDRNQVWIGDKIIPIGPTYAQCLQEF